MWTILLLTENASWPFCLFTEGIFSKAENISYYLNRNTIGNYLTEIEFLGTPKMFQHQQTFILFTAVVIISADPPHTGNSARFHQNFTDELLVDDTFRLITDGDRLINLNGNHTDIVLVIGNTGAGKTTITKFLAEVEKLESYDAGDRFLIRDYQQKISEKGTIISKTIFPDLIVDNSTQTAFYDLPGFSDTRNASVEIANAWFMKKVADHAKRVKLLFIVNYFSLRNGETRTNFKTFLEHAVALIKEPAKFKTGITLVATKVESNRSQEKIISGIASFLIRTKSDLVKVLNDESEHQAATDLIDAMLSKDFKGNYNRISFFKQPEELGPLTALHDVMRQKLHIENVVYNKTAYVPKSPEDFGFSVSPAAKLVTSKVAVKINQKINSIMVAIGEKMSYQFQAKINTFSLKSVGTIFKEQGRLEKMVDILGSNTTRTARVDFFKTFMKMLNRLNVTMLLRQELLELQQRQDNLNFFEEINGNKFQPSISDWLKPIVNAVAVSANAVTKKAMIFNNQMQNATADLSNRIFESFTQKLKYFIEIHEKSLQTYQTYTQKLNQMNKQIIKAKSVNNFINLIKICVNILDEEITTDNLVVLDDDLKLDRRSVFKLLPWVMPFEQLLTKLRADMYEFQVQELRNQNRVEIGEMSKALAALNASFIKTKLDQDKRTTKMREELNESIDAMSKQLATMRANHKKQHDMMMEMIRQNNEIIRQLENDQPWYSKALNKIG